MRHYWRPFALTDFFMQVITGDCRKKSSQKLSEPIRILLQSVQEALHVISVCGRMVASDGQGHENLALLPEELARLYRWKVVRLVFVGVDGKVMERDPWDTGYGIGVFRWNFPRTGQHAVIVCASLLPIQIGLIKHREALIIFSPHERKGLVVLMKRGVEGCQSIIESHLPVFFGHLEFRSDDSR